MRETKLWMKPITREIEALCTKYHISSSLLCGVELGLALIVTINKDLDWKVLPALLSGYPFPALEQYGWDDHKRRAVRTVRHLLPFYHNPYPWKMAIRRYQNIEERLRGYAIAPDGTITQRNTSIFPQRFDEYARVLRTPLKYMKRKILWAADGEYMYPTKKGVRSVTIPTTLVLPSPAPVHSVNSRANKKPIELTWSDLLAAAHEMDDLWTGKPENWEKRLHRVRFELFNTERTRLHKVEAFTITGIMNLIGMVSSGKSTLMEVLAYWAAQHGYHTTLVVSDVIGALDRADMFCRLGAAAVPVLGSSNRERHTNRLHQVLNARMKVHPFQQEHKGFDWLSTACAINGIREESRPLSVDEYSCFSFQEGESDAEPSGSFGPERKVCPVYSQCPVHQAQRDMASALIWIATPASLIHSAPALPMASERIRFLELVYRRSDLVIVDEADAVQVQIDNIFSPSETLVNRSRDAWLNRLGEHISTRLGMEGRSQLADDDAARWSRAHDMVQAAADGAYSLLLQNPELTRKVGRDYFTAWMFFEKVAQLLTSSDTSSEPYIKLMACFGEYVDDPLGNRAKSRDQALTGLVRLTQMLFARTNRALNRKALEAWIGQFASYTEVNEKKKELCFLQFEFAIQVAVLSAQLNILLRDWDQAEKVFQLDRANTTLSQGAPEDYVPLIPIPPMGNLLAFQYIRTGIDTSDAGQLRFFRCSGVGRWLLLHLHDFLADEGIAGPNVILLSGTSWAGTSPAYHIQIPVAGILHAPESEVHAIEEQSVFEFTELHTSDDSAPITVSGKTGEARYTALEQMVFALAGQKKGVSGLIKSKLEQLRDELPEGRKRVMLLVGSYLEAEHVRDCLNRLRPDWRGQVRSLIPDGDEEEAGWMASEMTIKRGMVSQFAQTNSWLLVAPLLAVERGHNILNEDDRAAIGAVYFMIRPHPRPDDIGLAIHSINQWAVNEYVSPKFNIDISTGNFRPLDKVAGEFRKSAHGQWHNLLRLPLVYSTMRADLQEALTWTQMVSIWQVIGRLVRGGSPARVYFCDGAFFRMTTEEKPRPIGSLIVEMRHVLKPYFDKLSSKTEHEKVLVKTLYGPLYAALMKTKGIPEDV